MKTRVSKLLAMSFMGLTASISFMGYNIWSQPRLEPEDRPSLPWNPQTKFGDSIPRPTAVPDQVGKVFARPLFSPSRKPFVAAEAAAEEVQTEPEAQPAAVSEPGFDPAQFVLKGILTVGPKRVALIATPDKPEGSWRDVGSELSGWIVTDIGQNAVTITFGEKSFLLQQYVDNSKLPLGLTEGNQ